MTETWLPVADNPRYEVSDSGQVRESGNHRLMPAHPNKGGHILVNIKYGEKWRVRYVHRLVLEAFIGPCPKGMETLHHDDVKSNNRLDNLRWGTRKENVADRLRNGNDFSRRKTHCPKGHPLSGDNLVPSQLARGSRSCKTCANEHARAQTRRKKALA